MREPLPGGAWYSELQVPRYGELPFEDIEIHRDYFYDLPHSSHMAIPGVLPDRWSGPPTGRRSWRVQICEHDLAEGVADDLVSAQLAAEDAARAMVTAMAKALGGSVTWADAQEATP